MSTLFEQIDKALTEVRDGWCSIQKAHLLASCVVALRATTVVEIGVWGGRSLIPMALACREMQWGKVTGIDPWDSKISSEGMTGRDLEWWSKTDHEPIYDKFMEHIRRLELSEWVRILRMKSNDAPLPDKIDLLSLDGNHSDQALADVKRFSPLVPIGGLILADDLNWSGGGVGRAIQHLQDSGFETLISIDEAALYKRVKRK